MTHKVGAKGQVVIPKELRDQAGIQPGHRVDFVLDDGGVRVVPHVRAAKLRGLVSGRAPFEELRRERDAELARDDERERQ